MRRALIAVIFGFSGCAAFPELDARIDDAARAAPYPSLQPIGPLLDQAARESASSTALSDDLQSRAAQLADRAAALRGPVIDGATRAEMQGGVDRGALQ